VLKISLFENIADVFDSVSNKFSNVFNSLKSKGKLTEDDIKKSIRKIKMILLEADVNYKVVKEFIAVVSEKALGSEILNGLTPGQQIIKIIRDELINILGNAPARLTFANKIPTCYMLVGLQGAGKTTVAGKLALYLKKQNKKVLLIACDVYRPAAIKQLKILGSSISVEVFSIDNSNSPVEIAKSGLDYALKNNFSIVIIDTAGRLNIDQALMQELKDIKSIVHPHEVLLVLDAMIGQEVVNIAQSFNEQLGIDGVIMSKLDSDTRGGAMISVRYITQKPIKFIGVGEKLNDLEQFYPDRIASRILGMGDVLSVIEKAQESISSDDIDKISKKIKKNDVDLSDFLSLQRRIKKLGSITGLLKKLMPGLASKMDLSGANPEAEMKKIEAIILSMTPYERSNPGIINASRKRRISKGCGHSVADINVLLKRFEEMKKLMKMFAGKKNFFNM